MTNKSKVLEHVQKYAVTYLFIALSILFILASGLDFSKLQGILQDLMDAGLPASVLGDIGNYI